MNSVPKYGQGIYARENQPGVAGGKIWLKSQKLEKYWPTFSHWSYSDITSLCEHNIDKMIKVTGSEGISSGDKEHLIHCIDELRAREDILGLLHRRLGESGLSISDALDYLMNVIDTPLPTDLREGLPTAIVSAAITVYDYLCRRKLLITYLTQMDEIFCKIMKSCVLSCAAGSVYNDLQCTFYWPFTLVKKIKQDTLVQYEECKLELPSD